LDGGVWRGAGGTEAEDWGVGVGVGLGQGLAGCGGFLRLGAALGGLVGWRGHCDGMAAGGDR